MNAKDKQKEIISKTLKPLLKEFGYKTSGQNWWKTNGDFFYVINLQNFSWNSKDSVDFCFNFSIGILKNKEKTKFSIHDGITYNRENVFLKKDINSFRNNTGYHIDLDTDIKNFSESIFKDFENIILPGFDVLNSVDSLLSFYKNTFWEERLKTALREDNLI